MNGPGAKLADSRGRRSAYPGRRETPTPGRAKNHGVPWHRPMRGGNLGVPSAPERPASGRVMG